MVLTKKQEKVNTLSYKTVSANDATVHKEWLIVDADNEVVGRLAAKVAFMLRGKHKADYTPHVDCGDNVIVINADKVRFTGKKWAQKEYTHHTGYPGGQRKKKAEDVLKKHPERIIEYAVKGMLPKNRLGNAILKNLRVYAGTEHQHEAQKPRLVNLNEIKE